MVYWNVKELLAAGTCCHVPFMQYDKARLQTFKKHRHTLMMSCYRWSNTPSFISKC